MSIVAALPLRGLADGKSRLRRFMPDRWRRALILALLERVARATVMSDAITTTVVISPDPAILTWVARLQLGLIPLRQTGTGLNAGLTQAAQWAKQHAGASALLALHADLPLLTSQSIDDMVAVLATAGDRPGIVVAGDRHRHGTNALLLRPTDAIPFRFGERSFGRHQAAGDRQGLAVIPYHDRSLGFDLDTPADLAALIHAAPMASLALLRETARRLPMVRLLECQSVPTHPMIPAPEA
jgi:2-phospho-L-lactate/phosphoenolpyruvate guanylyltransferase